MLVSAKEGYRRWASTYDQDPNPLLVLEERVLRDLSIVRGQRFLDAGTGTGRWLKRGLAAGAAGWGVDASEPMLRVAEATASTRQRLVLADLRQLPFADDFFDLAICSFALSYVDSFIGSLQELARVARRVVVSELHSAALAAGWTRSFRAAGTRYEIQHYHHCPDRMDTIMGDAGFQRDWLRVETFGEPERPIFEAAGKRAVFAEVATTPALCVASWTRACA